MTANGFHDLWLTFCREICQLSSSLIPKYIEGKLEQSSDLFTNNSRIYECFQKASRDFITIFL
jgi:hypothetical protein